jgi:SanA protein
MPKKRRLPKFVIIPIALLASAGLFCYGTNRAVLNNSEGKVFSSPETVPNEPVALVLGAAPYINGFKNPFFWLRINAAADLYRARKVAKILVSGDNGTKIYDEPTAMRDALVAQGVPTSAVVLDYAGFRTLDSVVRAHEIFGVTKCTIVTDDFHLPRALYIASERGLDAIGYQSAPVDRRYSTWTYTREVGARSLTWLDIHLSNRQPRFLGRKEPIHI